MVNESEYSLKINLLGAFLTFLTEVGLLKSLSIKLAIIDFTQYLYREWGVLFHHYLNKNISH